MPVARPQPRDQNSDEGADDRSADDTHRLHLEQERAHQQRRLHALSRDHQERETEHAQKCRTAPSSRRSCSQVAFDVTLDTARRPPHVHRQRRDRNRSSKSQDALPERLIRRALEQQGRADADDDRRRNAPLHRRDQLVTSALAQVGQTDGDDEKGFQSFPKRDDKCLKHDGIVGTLQVSGNETRSQYQDRQFTRVATGLSTGAEPAGLR